MQPRDQKRQSNRAEPCDFLLILATALLLSACGGEQTNESEPAVLSLAEKYPGDVGMESDPDVYFVENAEHGSLAELLARWGGSSASGSVSLDATAVPPGSRGAQSIRLTTTAGPLGPGTGTVRSAYLYKPFPATFVGPVHMRWYVRYNTNGTFHHSGPRLGGNSPLGDTLANSPAGVRPDGSDFFYVGVELAGAKVAPANTSPVDYYTYWPEMRGTSFFPGQYYGNSFINDPAVSIDLANWNCIELRFAPNDPPESHSGTLDLWINGQQVSSVSQGTLGTWVEDNFHPDIAGTPFEGFQWRNMPPLAANYIELMHFVDNDPDGYMNSVNYDHLVVANRYIGPLQ